jgi:murein DD-endopeptidase MepM/ murein hydrolase activator NlpD
MRWGGVACLLATVALAACVRHGGPAPIDDRGALFFGRGTAIPVARPAAERPTQSAAGGPRTPLVTTPGIVTVQQGDTLYGISRQNNVPIRAIINANNLQPPYNLPVGRPLVLPRQPYHRVAPGETVATIARTYGVSTQDLVRTNGIEQPYLIYVGQPLLLPVTTTAPGTAVAAAPPSGAATGSGNTAQPGAGNTSQAQPRASQAPASADALTYEGPPDTVASLPPPSAPAEAPITAPPGAFIWPVQGHVLSGFGAKPGGLVNDGINIAAAIGTPVRASQEGTVAYAGNELRGYGNLLLVRHDNGWMTAYAHNSELLVGRGDRVKRGQIIARVGASGSVTEPQLHFELRQGTRTVDPTRYLSGQGVSSR